MARKQGREGVVEEIRQRVRQGRYQVGDRLPSERDLAREFGVSRALIQNAVDSLITLGVISRLPNHRPVVAGKLAKQFGPDQTKSHIAVWIQPNLEDFGAASILQGVRAEIVDSGYSLLIGLPPSTERHTEQRAETEFLRQIVRRPDVSGAIVWETGGPGFESVYPALIGAGIPVVFIDREPPETIEADVVETNNRRGARKAIQHLIGLGHRDIAMVVNDEPASSVRDRRAGYESAMADAGLSPKVFEMALGAWEREPDGPQRFVDEILLGGAVPTAIFAVNDQIALFLKDALNLRGVRVPDALSIVGFDWLLRSLPSGGELTTVAQPFEEIGRIAARRLLERIAGNEPNPTRHILLEAPLVVRTTTAPPRTDPIPEPTKRYS